MGDEEVLELGRLRAGPRLSWKFDVGELVGGLRVQWDYLQLYAGQGRFSAAADLGLRVALTPGMELGIYGQANGIGRRDADEFALFSTRTEFKASF